MVTILPSYYTVQSWAEFTGNLPSFFNSSKQEEWAVLPKEIKLELSDFLAITDFFVATCLYWRRRAANNARLCRSDWGIFKTALFGETESRLWFVVSLGSFHWCRPKWAHRKPFGGSRPVVINKFWGSSFVVGMRSNHDLTKPHGVVYKSELRQERFVYQNADKWNQSDLDKKRSAFPSWYLGRYDASFHLSKVHPHLSFSDAIWFGFIIIIFFFPVEKLNQNVPMAEWYNNFNIVGLSVCHTEPLVSCSLIPASQIKTHVPKQTLLNYVFLFHIDLCKNLSPKAL